jgi:membrane protein DedA with SNARE-associated domain
MPRAASVAAAGAGASAGAGLGLPGLGVLLAAMEAGVPIPVPSDLVVLVLGERTAAGTFPIWAAVLLLEVVAVVGTGALLLACRGPGRAVISRLGPRLGLTAERLGKATALVERRGRGALAIGRATPGLRTLTVLAAGSSGVSPARALPALVVGSSVFLQLHLVLGYVLGPVARDAIESAKGPAIAVLVVLALAGVALWIRKRGRAKGVQASAEACCPACLALGLLVPRAAGMESMT